MNENKSLIKENSATWKLYKTVLNAVKLFNIWLQILSKNHKVSFKFMSLGQGFC